MRSVTLFAAILLTAAAPYALPQNSAGSKPPTVADAQAFLNRANADLLKLSTDAARAQWLAETDINEDTEATSALLNQQATARTLELTEQSHRFDHLELPADLRRQIMLMQVNAPAAPKDPKLLAEQTTLAAQLTGMYGKGKYCPDRRKGLPLRPAPRLERTAWASMPSRTKWRSRAILRN